MTIQEQIMQARTAAGLVIEIQDTQGRACTLYPKDMATKQRWIAAYRQRGFAILEEKPCVS
jgi:hypothetical protein